jgi:hypothetical protein
MYLLEINDILKFVILSENPVSSCKKMDRNVGCKEKRHFVRRKFAKIAEIRRKFAKIAENCGHNVGPK